MNHIEPYALWLGNIGDCRATSNVLNLGILAVLQLAIEEPLAPFPRETIVIRVPLQDGSGNGIDDLRLAVVTLEQLLRAKIPTFLCCSMGMSRTPAVAAVALARIERRDPQELLGRLSRTVRTDVSPMFWRELLASFAAE